MSPTIAVFWSFFGTPGASVKAATREANMHIDK
jgi:hypothetical protein